MGNAAVMKLKCNFFKTELIIYKQLFYPLDFVSNKEFLYCGALCFRKKVGKI